MCEYLSFIREYPKLSALDFEKGCIVRNLFSRESKNVIVNSNLIIQEIWTIFPPERKINKVKKHTIRIFQMLWKQNFSHNQFWERRPMQWYWKHVCLPRCDELLFDSKTAALNNSWNFLQRSSPLSCTLQNDNYGSFCVIILCSRLAFIGTITYNIIQIFSFPSFLFSVCHYHIYLPIRLANIFPTLYLVTSCQKLPNDTTLVKIENWQLSTYRFKYYSTICFNFIVLIIFNNWYFDLFSSI